MERRRNGGPGPGCSPPGIDACPGAHQGGADGAGAHQGGADEAETHQGGTEEPEALQGGADETEAHQGGADETEAHQGGADETGAHQGGADETGAHQGGAGDPQTRAEDHQTWATDRHGGAADHLREADWAGNHDRIWDLRRTRTNNTGRAETDNTEKAFLVSGAVAGQVEGS